MKQYIGSALTMIVFVSCHTLLAIASYGAGVTNLLDGSAVHPSNYPSRLVLKPSQVTISEQGAQRRVYVSLAEDRYIFEKGQMRQNLFRYQLAGATNGTTISRELWSPSHLSGFALLSVAPARTYLFWLDGPLLCCSEISSTATRTNPPVAGGITSSSQADHVINLSVFEHPDKFWGRRADNCELGIVSVALATNGAMSVTATNIFGETFSFSNEGGEWRAFGESGELLRDLRKRP